MNKPTLRQQLADRKLEEEIEKLSEEELINLLLPHTFWQHINFWLFEHIRLLHYLLWKLVCFIYPFNTVTHSRHWRWDNYEEEDK